MSFSLARKRVFVAGHRGMVGRALVRRLQREPVTILEATRDEVDLTEQAATERWFMAHRPHVVIVAAARVGGIAANAARPVAFLEDNLLIQTNIMRAAYRCGVEKLLFLASSCIYPKFASQPIEEISLLTGALEPTNQWYAIAKIAGVKLAEAYRIEHGADFIAAMPTNLYGPGDNYDLETSHVAAALLRKIHEAKRDGRASVEIWGTGTPRREFLHCDDLADACLFLLENYSEPSPINVGTGEDVTIAELARILARVVGFEGTFHFDTSRPDGTPRKLLDVSRLSALGWNAKIPLEDGMRQTYAGYREREASGVPG